MVSLSYWMKLLAHLLLTGGGNLQIGTGKEVNCDEAIDSGDKGEDTTLIQY